MNKPHRLLSLLRVTTQLSAKFFYKQTLFALSFLLFASFLYSCKDQDGIGLDIQPVNDKFIPLFNNTEQVTSYSIAETHLRTDETVYNLLGSYFDPLFGKTDCSFFTQVLLSADAPDFTGAVLDSSVLSITYNSHYSDPAQISSLQHLKVFELTTSVNKDLEYYSNSNITDNYNPALPIADVFFSPQPSTGVLVGSEVQVPQLRINFPAIFGQRFLDLQNAPSLINNTAFLQFFKGFYVSVDNPAQTMGQGAILSFNTLSATSKFTIYYTVNNVPTQFGFIINNTCARANFFKHDYVTSTAINDQLANPILGQTLSYIQPMAGIKTKLELPFLKKWSSSDSSLVAINKVEIIIKVDESITSKFAPANKLILVALDADGNNVFLPDQFEGDDYFGGVYNATTKKYTFNIGRYAQQVINKQTTDYGLYLMCAGASVVANRTVIKGGQNIVVNISYTKL